MTQIGERTGTLMNTKEDGNSLPIQINTGWWLDAVCACDLKAPGFAGSALRAPAIRRQIIAAYLALIRDDDSAVQRLEQSAHDKSTTVASLVMQEKPQNLLKLIFGSCPPGLEGALRKVGEQPQPPEFYMKLYEIFEGPASGSQAQVLLHSALVNHDSLILLEGLPSPFQRPGILTKIQPQQLEQVITSLEIIKTICPGATDAALADSVKRLIRNGSLPEFAAHWTLRAQLPPPPFPGDEDVTPITTVKMMHSEAIAFKNCLRQMVFPALAGETYFYRFKHKEKVGIAQLSINSAGKWYLEGGHGIQNARLGYPLMRRMDDWFAAKGVTRFRRGWRKTQPSLRVFSDLVHEYQSTSIAVLEHELDDLIEDLEGRLDA